jgi:hypothetical protein
MVDNSKRNLLNGYKRLLNPVLCLLFCFAHVGCASLYPLQPVAVIENSPIGTYQYVVIAPTNTLTSSTAGLYGNNYSVYGAAKSKSINPADVIKGSLVKSGFIVLPEVKSELLNETLIVNYGESGRRNLGLGYSIEVTIQFISAENSSLISSCSAEGIGETEADDIRIAIRRCLNALLVSENL